MSPYKLLVSDPKNHIGEKVHVEGWNFACVFILEEFKNGVAKLVTPRTKKVYYTENRLIHTREYQHKWEESNRNLE